MAHQPTICRIYRCCSPSTPHGPEFAEESARARDNRTRRRMHSNRWLVSRPRTRPLEPCLGQYFYSSRIVSRLFIRGSHRAKVTELCRKDTKWRHEDASEMMFDHLVEDNEIDINDVDRAFIKALIACQPEKCLYVCHSVDLVTISRSSSGRKRNPSCLKLFRTIEMGLTSTSACV